MARKKRQWYPGATYHVMSRGNRRNAIFKEKYDYVTFLEYIELVQGLFPFKLHSVCQMTNHFHMLIETANDEIWKIMQKLLSLYASEFNHRYSYSGHLFEGRYTACAIEDARYFLEVSRYIHLNPVKARMVREPLTYAYSSYGLFVNCEKDKGGTVDKLLRALVDTSRVLASFHNNPREQYRIFVEGKIPHAEQEMLIQKDMKEDEMWLPW